MTQLFPRQTIYGASYTLTGAGDALAFRPGRPVVVTDWGFIITTACTGTSAAVTGNVRPTAGSTAGQTVGATSTGTGPAGETQVYDTAGGKMTIAATQNAGTVVAHKVSPVVAQNGAVSGQTGSTSPQGVTVNPGQEFAINVGTGMGTAGAGTPYVTFYELPAAGDSTATGSNNPMANVTFLNG